MPYSIQPAGQGVGGQASSVRSDATRARSPCGSGLAGSRAGGAASWGSGAAGGAGRARRLATSSRSASSSRRMARSSSNIACCVSSSWGVAFCCAWGGVLGGSPHSRINSASWITRTPSPRSQAPTAQESASPYPAGGSPQSTGKNLLFRGHESLPGPAVSGLGGSRDCTAPPLPGRSPSTTRRQTEVL